MIDAYVRPTDRDCDAIPASSYYVLQYRYKTEGQDDSWTECSHEKMEQSEFDGRLDTIVSLNPLTDYEVRARIVSGNRQSTIAESQIQSIVTSTPMTHIQCYTALYDFDARVEHEVSIRIDDILLEDPNLERASIGGSSTDGYVYVRNQRTMQCGYVPLITVARKPSGDIPGKMEEQEYYFTINRRKAEVWMMRPNVETGRFIVRPSHNPDEFKALSVRLANHADGMPTIQHFKVYVMPDHYGCYVNVPARIFEDINKLISFYKENPLRNTRLTQPFPRNPQPPRNLDEIAIPSGKVTILEKLGGGRFGQVYKGKLNRLLVAAKKLIPPDDGDATDDRRPSAVMTNSEELMREAREMARYFHDNIVRLIGVCVDKQPFLIISELMNRGALVDCLKDDNFAADFHVDMVVFVLGQIACGMAYLEEMHVAHRDLRAANVLVHDENGQLEIKITDFGLTRRMKVDEEIYEAQPDALFPIRWAAPEALKTKQFSTKSDVWSFGILACEVFTLGVMPYKGMSNDDVRQFVASGGRMTAEQCRLKKRVVAANRFTLPDALFDQIARCWNQDPASRPTFAALYDLLDNYSGASDYTAQF